MSLRDNFLKHKIVPVEVVKEKLPQIPLLKWDWNTNTFVAPIADGTVTVAKFRELNFVPVQNQDYNDMIMWVKRDNDTI